MHQGSEALPKRTPPGGREACGADDRNKLRSVTAAERNYRMKVTSRNSNGEEHRQRATQRRRLHKLSHLYQLMPPTMWSKRDR